MKKLFLVLAMGVSSLVYGLDNHKYKVGDTITLSTGSNSDIYLAVKSNLIKDDYTSYKGIIRAKNNYKVVITNIYINDDNNIIFEAKDENGVIYHIDRDRALLLEEIKSHNKSFKPTKKMVSEYNALLPNIVKNEF